MYRVVVSAVLTLSTSGIIYVCFGKPLTRLLELQLSVMSKTSNAVRGSSVAKATTKTLGKSFSQLSTIFCCGGRLPWLLCCCGKFRKNNAATGGSSSSASTATSSGENNTKKTN